MVGQWQDRSDAGTLRAVDQPIRPHVVIVGGLLTQPIGYRRLRRRLNPRRLSRNAARKLAVRLPEK